MKNYVLTLALMIFSISSIAQKNESKGMDEMWGEQRKVGTDTSNSKTTLFDEGNYSMFIHWGIYSNIANKWKASPYSVIS